VRTERFCCPSNHRRYPLPPFPDSNPRISRCATPTIAACAAFFKESRMQFAEPTKLDEKSGTYARGLID
jgi:hypothetical protein